MAKWEKYRQEVMEGLWRKQRNPNQNLVRSTLCPKRVFLYGLIRIRHETSFLLSYFMFSSVTIKEMLSLIQQQTTD